MTTFEFGGRYFNCVWWAPCQGKLSDTLSFDCETALIEEGKTPQFVVGGAYANGNMVYLVKLHDLAQFLHIHANAKLIMHHAPFDLDVLENETGFDFDTQVRGNRIIDTGLLFILMQLSRNGKTPLRWSLDYVFKETTGLTLNKDAELRCGFGKYRHGHEVRYDEITRSELIYLAKDVIATSLTHEKLYREIQAVSPKFLLSHKIQLMGAIGLYNLSKLGIGFDVANRNSIVAAIEDEVQNELATLKRHGVVPGSKGVSNCIELNLASLQETHNIALPRTAKTGVLSKKAEDLAEYRHTSEFIDSYLRYRELEKTKSFVLGLTSSRVHPTYTYVLNTGRTSCRNPNIQNLPRKDGIRKCFVPAQGYVFCIIDYSTIELRALAQVCRDRFGFSKMGELINLDKDLHTWFASLLLCKDPQTVTRDERQIAKACNFGFPGGLGIARFIEYAQKSFGTTLTKERARELKEAWLNAFPEMRSYLREPLLSKHDFSGLDWCDKPEIAVALFKRIIAGNVTTKTGEPYHRKALEWAFEEILPAISPKHAGLRNGSPELLEDVTFETVVTRTGRIRAKTGFCQARNTPFQGLAADGAKVALYRLVKAKFRVVAFVHDEFVVEIPQGENATASAKEIEKIVVDAMQVLIPDIKIKAEWHLAERWEKEPRKPNIEGAAQPLDDEAANA